MRGSGIWFSMVLASCVPFIAHADPPLPYLAGPPVPCLNLPPNAIMLGPIICKTVTLHAPSDLAQLKESSPDDYVIARRVMQAASRLCLPGEAKPQIVGLSSADVACSATVYPSNPPKREVWFKVGHTMYRMIVAIEQ